MQDSAHRIFASVFEDCKIVGNIHDNPDLLRKDPDPQVLLCEDADEDIGTGVYLVDSEAEFDGMLDW